jgi:enoyl-CoA hydratase/carnithine racemase
MPLIHERIELTIKDNVAHVSLARPDKMNALDTKMFEAIPLVGELQKADESVRTVIVSGQGGNFCAGLDKSNFEGLLQNKGVSIEGDGNSTKLAERTHGIANAVQYTVWMWRELPMPVIAAVEGVALGGGLQISLGADIRIAAPDSRFSILELKWGIIPDMSSTQIMRHMVRDDVIRELTYTARIFSAQEAKEWGFITHISENPLEHAKRLAHEIVMKNPDAIRAAKRVIDKSYHQSPSEGLLMESVEQDQIMGSANQIEAVMAALQKRAPNFKD